MKLSDLVGYQLVAITDKEIVVCKDGREHRLTIEDDYGGCCGYNEITAKLLVSETELHRNPVITNVEHTRTDTGESAEVAKVTLFGEYKPLAVLDTLSSSGSGWCYGAAVTIACRELELEEEISSW